MENLMLVLTNNALQGPAVNYSLNIVTYTLCHCGLADRPQPQHERRHPLLAAPVNGLPPPVRLDQNLPWLITPLIVWDTLAGITRRRNLHNNRAIYFGTITVKTFPLGSDSISRCLRTC